MSQYTIRAYKGVIPTMDNSVYIDPTATVIGDVVMEKDCSVWPMSVIRGDVNKVRMGKRCNIQDASVIHVSRPRPNNPEGYPTILGDDVSIAHKVMLHGCTIGNRVLIGMGAIVLDGVVIEDDVMVGAGALITPGKLLKSGYLYMGTPARQTRPLKDSERDMLKRTANDYAQLKEEYRDNS